MVMTFSSLAPRKAARAATKMRKRKTSADCHFNRSSDLNAYVFAAGYAFSRIALLRSQAVSIAARSGLLCETPEKDGWEIAALDGETIFEDCRANIREDFSQFAGPLMVKHGQ